MLGRVEGLARDLERIAARAAGHAGPGEEVTGVLASEPGLGRRVYLCSFESNGSRSWLALDDDGQPVTSRNEVRESVAIAAMCELAADSAGGGELEELRDDLAPPHTHEHPKETEHA